MKFSSKNLAPIDAALGGLFLLVGGVFVASGGNMLVRGMGFRRVVSK